MEPRIVYCKPKSKQFIGSYQSEILSSVCAPETIYCVNIDKFFGACEMYSNNSEPIASSADSDSSSNYDDKNTNVKCDQDTGKVCTY